MSEARTDRNGHRPDIPSLARGKPTLPPLPSLQTPLYIIPDRRKPASEQRKPRDER
jgi:hypothetical protein